MTSQACLKCGHFADNAGGSLSECPMCGASYAGVESALARGETIARVLPDDIVTQQQEQEAGAREPPGRLVSILLALGFSLIVLALLAGIGTFVMILSAPSSTAPWTRENELFVRSLVIGWSAASLVCLGYAVLRRPLAGVLAGAGAGLLAGILSAFLFY